MGFFKKKTNETKCKECGMELHDNERLERHMKKAHGRPSQRSFDERSSGGGMW